MKARVPAKWKLSYIMASSGLREVLKKMIFFVYY